MAKKSVCDILFGKMIYFVRTLLKSSSLIYKAGTMGGVGLFYSIVWNVMDALTMARAQMLSRRMSFGWNCSL